MSSLVHGVGYNDADYKVSEMLGGKKKQCPYYARWKNLLQRCYCAKKQKEMPCYIGCSVCEEWLTFSNFKAWMETQDWEGKHLDKDLLVQGNKVYSPETCVFIDPIINGFLIGRGTQSKAIFTGVAPPRGKRPYPSASISNPFTKKNEFLGYYLDDFNAHLAWKAKKHEYACKLADIQEDSRVAAALKKRFYTSQTPIKVVRLLYGIAIDDTSYVKHRIVSGKRVRCKAYTTWARVLYSVYGKNVESKYTLCKDWLIFSNFKDFYDNNHIDGFEFTYQLFSEGEIGPKSSVSLPPSLSKQIRSLMGGNTTTLNNIGSIIKQCEDLNIREHFLIKLDNIRSNNIESHYRY